jgi:hypothetical protein
MARKPTAPRSPEAALRKGYNPVGDLAAFAKDHLGVSEDAFADMRQQYRATAGVDCTTAADGTLCFDSWRDGKHVVGYCRNGSCNIMSDVGG